MGQIAPGGALISISEGASVRTLVELTTDDGHVLPAGSTAYVTSALQDGSYVELDVKIGADFDTARATAEQVEQIDATA